MKIGLLGFGVVGRGVYDVVEGRGDMAVTKVLCRRERSLPHTRMVQTVEEILRDPEIDTVVEAIGGLHPAFEYVRAAIEAGKNVVTANKALVCTYYDVLLPLARAKGVSFRSTAAVGGGIGWLRELEQARRVQALREVGGIMNGTCNYILDNMARQGGEYASALQEAQSLGYAEADPSTDVDGIDTWHKAILSANIAFGVSVERESVPVAGIGQIQAQDVAQFRSHGLVCKLMATGRRTEDGVSVFVQPTLVREASMEAAVPKNYNLVTFVGETSGPMSFYGQGAGRYPTAYNVVQDLADVQAGKHFYAPCAGTVKARNDQPLRYYVRGDWSNPAEETWGDGVITKPVAVDDMHRWLRAHPTAFGAALV